MEESPSVEQCVTLAGGLEGEVISGLSAVRISGYFTSPEFFNLFGLELAKGDPSTALSLPEGIVLSEETAEKLFGKDEPVGQRISIKGLNDFVVTGILRLPQGKSHLRFDALASSTAVPLLEKEGKIPPLLSDWKNYYASYTYIRLKQGHSMDEIAPVLSRISDQSYRNLSLETRDAGYSFELQPLRSISPGPILSNETSRSLPASVLYFLVLLAVIGMIAAVFNYTNLTLARSLTRAKEVGIRKVVGASRVHVFLQLVAESIVMALIALTGGVILLQTVLIPTFRSLGFMHFVDIDLEVSASTYLLFIGLSIFVGMIAGTLPAAIISRFRPTLILKDLSKVRVFRVLTPRMALVIFQFALSLILIIVLTTAVRQLNYALTFPNGFRTSNIVSIDLQGQEAQLVRNELQGIPAVVSISAVSHHMGTWEDASEDVQVTEGAEPQIIRDYSVDEQFLDHFGLTLVAGANFNPVMGQLEEKTILVNEKFVEQFHLSSAAEAVGTSVILNKETRVRIAGVIKDFLYKPLTYGLEPLMLRYDPTAWRYLDVKLGGTDVQGALDQIGRAWRKIDSVHPLMYERYKDILSNVYSNLWDLLKIVGFLAFLAFVISTLGLLGILTYNAETRMKEFGIRKVMGAGNKHLAFLVAKSELIMLVIATALAVPLSLWISSQLLQTFAYRISLGLVVTLPGLLAVYGISALAVLWQTVRLARTTPVEILRYE
jgi:putative ABC transport system permease protein